MAGDSMALDKQQAAYNARMEEIRETEFRHCKGNFLKDPMHVQS